MSENKFEQSLAKSMKTIGFQNFVTEHQKSLASRTAIYEQLASKIGIDKSTLRRNQATPAALVKVAMFSLLVSGLPTQL
jgi:hypothetical protein